jgi:hypothetical protein
MSSSRRRGVANDAAASIQDSLIVLLNQKAAVSVGFDEMNADWRQRPFPIAMPSRGSWTVRAL